MLDDHHYLTVTDIKQFTYCQRIIYYERCLPHLRPRTYKMDAGRDAHQDEEKRSRRRSLSKFEIGEGERRFNVKLQSDRLHLVGEVDEVIYGKNGEIIPVDYKLSTRVSYHYKLQLTAYAMLLAEAEHTRIEHGFLYLIPKSKLVKIEIPPQLVSKVENMLIQMQSLIENERMPEPTINRNHCVDCEFRRFCNDISV